MTGNTIRNLNDEFIINYKAAIKAKFTREEFARHLKIKPDSLIRRRLTIQKETGLNLPILDSVPSSVDTDLDQSKLDAFNSFVLEQKNQSGITSNTQLQAKKIYVITAAQNATPVHTGFLANILNYCDERDAQFLVIPYRYRNATSIWTQNNENDDWWNQAITPYIWADEQLICKNLKVLGNISIQPTAKEPLSQFDSYTGVDSAIFGHPKVQLRSIATQSHILPKLLLTTGAITVQNYVQSKAGRLGAFHHSFAAIVVELDEDNIFHVRHIHADEVTGAFYDLDRYYCDGKSEKINSVAALITGDTHAEFIDDKVMAATYKNKDSIVEVLNPETIVFHDLMDFYARNHHHEGNDIVMIGKHRYGRNNVEDGLQIAADFIDEVSRPNSFNVIVKSNHDEAFDKWLQRCDPKIDPENAQFYHWMKYNQAKHIQMTKTGFDTVDPFEFWCKNPDRQKGLQNIARTRFLSRGEPLSVNGIELGFHGDFGLNGARGSAKSFAKVGTKTVIGHGHYPEIYEGCYRVGVSARLDLEYQKGQCSNWLHTHCVVYPDGKRTLIHIIKGKWKI